MNRKQILPAAAAAVCIIIVICAAFFFRSRTGGIEVINAAQESVIHATVEINGEKFNIDNLPPDAIRKLKYKPAAANQYTVSVEFRYDRKLGPQSGYFAGRLGGNHQLVIRHDEIVLESGR